MKKLIVMTALALVLAAPAAHAEYTGNGAIAPSDSLGSSSGSGATSNPSTTDKLKDKWTQFKSNHEDTLEKLKAERAAHWHNVANGKSSPSDGSDAAGGDTGAASHDAGTDAPAHAADSGDGPRPSKWEKFKTDHAQDGETLKDHAETAKSHVESDADKAKTGLHDWKQAHEEDLGHAKEKVQAWEADHKDKIEAVKDGVKDKWAAWKEKHSSSN